MKYETIGETML